MEPVRTLAQIEADITQVKEELAQVRGTETEVYARIVGYYRSVRNWNKGKRDEYNHRKQFVCDGIHSDEREAACAAPHTAAANTVAAHTVNAEGIPAFYEFFGRTTCPNCPPVKNYLASIDVEGRYIDVDTEEGLSRAAQAGVLAAPTVIVFDKNGEEIARAHNVAELSRILVPAKQHVA